jgi:hypothetical protein
MNSKIILISIALLVTAIVNLSVVPAYAKPAVVEVILKSPVSDMPVSHYYVHLVFSEQATGAQMTSRQGKAVFTKTSDMTLWISGASFTVQVSYDGVHWQDAWATPTGGTATGTINSRLCAKLTAYNSPATPP